MSLQPTRGVKRVCQSADCTLPFYDLNRTDVACPHCGTVFDATFVLYPRRDQSTSTYWKSASRRSRPFETVRPVEAADAEAQSNEVDEATPISDDATDATDDGIPARLDDTDDEIPDVIPPREDDEI